MMSRYYTSRKIFLKISVKKFSFCEDFGSKTANGQNNKFLTLPYAVAGVGMIKFHFLEKTSLFQLISIRE